ncbi:MAG: HNH endonuclease signature motif containing protein [Vicinamibacterales bacterium]
MASILDGIVPDAEDVAPKGPIWKGATALDVQKADDRDEKAAERKWRKEVIARDGNKCRCCKRTVVAQLDLAGNRREIHHVTPRADQAVRWDKRNGIVVCADCHQKLTPHSGRQTLVILQLAKFLFRVGQKTYINAAKKVTFKEIAA